MKKDLPDNPPLYGELLHRLNNRHTAPRESPEGGYLEIWCDLADMTFHTETPAGMHQRASACWLLTLGEWNAFAEAMKRAHAMIDEVMWDLDDMRKLHHTLGFAEALARMDNDLGWWRATFVRLKGDPHAETRIQAQRVLDAMDGP